MKKNLSVLVLLSLVLLAAAGAVFAEKVELNEVGTYPIVKEPLEMTMFRLSMPNVVDYATNDFTKHMEELTGISWKFDVTTNDASEEAVNLTMLSKKLPDVLLFVAPNIAKYGVAEGMLLPIEDLIADNMPNFSKVLEEKPELLAQITETDGHIYGLPAINECYHCQFRNKMWVNTAILEELGLEVPTTTEEFKEVVKAYVEKNPNGIAITGSTDGWGQQFADWLINPFILDPGSGGTRSDAKLVYNTETNKVETIAIKDEYREALKYMRELFDLGAIYDGSFTQNHEQYRTLMNQDGDPVLFAPYGTISDGYDVASKPESYAKYRVVAPLVGPEGVQNATYFKYDGVSQGRLVITVDAENPEAILRWADYFYTMEGYLSMQYGADEGKDWELAAEGELGLGGDPALYKILNPYSSEPQNHDWQDVGLNYATAMIRMGESTAQDIDIASAAGLEKLLYIETRDKMEPYGQGDNAPYTVTPPLKLTAEEATELQVISKEIADYVESNRTAFIRGDQDVNDDAAWQAYVDGFEALQLPRFLEVYQAAFDRQFNE